VTTRYKLIFSSLVSDVLLGVVACSKFSDYSRCLISYQRFVLLLKSRSRVYVYSTCVCFVKVGKLKETSTKAHNAELKLWLEVNLTGQVIFFFLLWACPQLDP
jgi:hypothetical protein